MVKLLTMVRVLVFTPIAASFTLPTMVCILCQTWNLRYFAPHITNFARYLQPGATNEEANGYYDTVISS